MSDEIIIHECIKLSTYNNITLLRIEIERVSDIRLIRGFLTDLYSKHETYGIDPDDILNIISEYNSDYQNKTSDEVMELMKEENNYFRNKMTKISDQNIKNYEDVLVIIDHLKAGNIKFMKRFINNSNNIESLQHSKDVFIKSELFEYLAMFDERINQLQS